MTMSVLRTVPDDILWSADRLEIAGWTMSSTVDWPDRTVLTVLLQGCPWTCAPCETPELRSAMTPGAVPWREVHQVLVRSRSGLDGVVFSGGEPTRQDGLADAMEQARALGVPVALHTSGSYPQRLAAVLSLADRVVLEIKAPSTLYRAVTGVAASAHKAFANLRLCLDSGVDLQVRTTVDPALLTVHDVARLRENLILMGVRDHVVTEVEATPEAGAGGQVR